jgi:Glycosyltransferase family 87
MEAIQPSPLSAPERWRLAGRRAVTHSLIVWPPLAVGWLLAVAVHRHALAVDFDRNYLTGARAVVEGHSPYPLATVAASFPRDSAFIYPPLTAYLAAPFLLLPPIVAESLVCALMIALVAATLWLLDVRDWRCYAIVFLWVPVYSGIQTGNVMLPLAFGIALVWRYRDRAAVAALATGALVAIKLIAWPLLIWLVASRRFRAAGDAVLAAVALVILPWAGIGFAGMTAYPHLLRVLTEAERAGAYSIPALISGSLGWSAAELVGFAIGLAVLAVAVGAARRGHQRPSFSLAVASMLLLTPIVEMQYFVFFLVVLALLVPRFGWLWAAPLLFWVGPQGSNGAPWQTAAVLAVAAWVLVLAIRGPRVASRRFGFLRS